MYVGLKEKERVRLIGKLGDKIDNYDDGRRTNTEVFVPVKDEFGIFIEQANNYVQESKEGGNKLWVWVLGFLLVGFSIGVWLLYSTIMK